MGTDFLTRLSGGFLKYRYWLLSLALFVLMGLHSYNGLWVGDFWEHSSVIRELALHPLHPQHPQLLINAPHAFYTPYHLIWALFSRWTGVSAISTLELAGMINLWLLLTGLFWFISAFKPRNRDGAAFYSLLFMLLLWGSLAWNYSGFYHLGTLGWVIPYPSTFAIALTFFALAINQRRIDTGRDLLLLPVFLIAIVVLLSHQITFIFLALGLISFSLRAPGRLWVELLKIGGLLALALGLAAFWPYYPFIQLLLGGSAVFHASNQDMYQHVIIRIWPASIGIPFLVLEGWRDHRQPLVWMFAGLLVIYIIGGVSGAYSYGRVISYMVVILDLIIALYVARWETKITIGGQPLQRSQAFFSIGFSLVLVILAFQSFISPLTGSLKPQMTNRYARFQFLSSYTKPDDVVLAPAGLNLYVPTFGGKVVAFDRPLAFVPDQTQRQEAVNRFFDLKDSQSDRIQTLQQYGVKYILLEKTADSNWESLRTQVAPFTDLIYRGKRYLLFSIDPARLP